MTSSGPLRPADRTEQHVDIDLTAPRVDIDLTAPATPTVAAPALVPLDLDVTDGLDLAGLERRRTRGWRGNAVTDRLVGAAAVVSGAVIGRTDRA